MTIIRAQDIGFWVLGSGFWVLGSGFWSIVILEFAEQISRILGCTLSAWALPKIPDICAANSGMTMVGDPEICSGFWVLSP
ncbi:hypothetical protein BCT84_09975 [Vibrio breoganii]|nr:hypothetical protein BCU03_07710 [Vibrio breoganii]PML14666.1 hypothetical protein BCT84_09975 [Vibrio breoganii]